MSAPVIHNPDIPAYSPRAGDAVVVTFDDLVYLGAITSDPGDPITLIFQPSVPDLKKNGTTVGFATTTLVQGESLTWLPTGFGGQPTEIASFFASVQFGTSVEIGHVRVRVPVADGGQDGPFTVAPGTRVDAAEYADPGATPDITVTVRNEHGDAIVFNLDEDFFGWDQLDFSDDPDIGLVLPPVSSNILQWEAPRASDQFAYAAALTDQGLQLITFWPLPDDTLGHSIRNLTAETGAPALVGEIDRFVTNEGLVYIVGRTIDYDVVVFHQTGAGTPDNYQWVAENLYDQLRDRSLEAPWLSGPLVTYVTSWNGLNIAGLDTGGNIWGIWTSPALDHWESSNLSAITGAPQISGLSVFLTPWGATNLVGREWGSGHITVTWWLPEFGGTWAQSDYSQLFGFQSLRADTLTSYVNVWGALNIAGIDDSGELHVFWWEPTRAGTDHDVWSDSIIQPVGAGRFAVNARITALSTSDQRINLFGTDPDGRLVRAWWRPDFAGNWRFDTLSA